MPGRILQTLARVAPTPLPKLDKPAKTHTQPLFPPVYSFEAPPVKDPTRSQGHLQAPRQAPCGEEEFKSAEPQGGSPISSVFEHERRVAADCLLQQSAEVYWRHLLWAADF
jgi:hypothetical protein